MNKIIVASDVHKYINNDSGKILEVKLTVEECTYMEEPAKVTIKMGSKKLDEEE